MSSVHLEDVFKCNSCDKKYFYKRSLANHVKQHHTVPEKIDIHKCEICGFTAKVSSYLAKHMKNSHSSSTCPEKGCSKKLTNSQLSYHIKTVHKQKKYPCQYCKYISIDQSNLKRHIKKKHKYIQISSKAKETKRVPTAALASMAATAAPPTPSFSPSPPPSAPEAAPPPAEIASSHYPMDELYEHIQKSKLPFISSTPTVSDGNCWYDALYD